MAEEPHDKLFKETFRNPKNAAVELRAVLPPSLLAKVNLDSLRTVSGLTIGRDLSVRHCDVLYEAEILSIPSLVYIVLEHQSAVDRWMPFRMLEYVVRVLSQFLAENSGKGKFLPLVLPIVVHHSETGWTAKTEISELYADEFRTDADLIRYIPRLSFLLDDLSKATDDELLRRALTASEKVVSLVFWALRDARDASRLLAGFHVWARIMGEIARSASGKDALLAVIEYLTRAKAELSREQIDTIVSEASPEVQEALMTLADQLEEKGRREGEARGRAEGKAEGEAIGLTKGKAETVLKLVTLKFGAPGAEITARIHAASIEELDRYAEKILFAANVGELFRG